MRRLILAPALLACLLLPAAADAAQLQRHAVTQSAAAVVSHWTPARMRAAKPADKVLTPSGARARAKPPKAAVAWSSFEVTTPYTDQPTSTHGKVFFTLGGVDYVCSGTALLSGNKSVVWTAGHCVSDPTHPGDFATAWAFVPGYRDGATPFGVFSATDLLTTSAWGNGGDFSYDEGAAVVGTANGRTLTDAVGGRGIAFNYNRSQHYQSHGYPAAPPFDGERHWVCDSTLATSDSSSSPATMGIGCDMTGGSSGGGWIVGSSLYSVNSYGYSNQPNVMFGPYMDSTAQSLYTAASST